MSAANRKKYSGPAQHSLAREATPAAFTLIEVLGVLAIVALLTAIALPALRGARNRLAMARAKSELAVLAQGLEEFRRYYGDYPQTGEFPQASPATAREIETTQAQAKLFNALTGVFGPNRLSADQRIDGRAFVEATRFTLEHALPVDFQVSLGSPPQKREERICFLDPWGRRYLYYYKSARDPGLWEARGYILYSAGPDGLELPPDAQTGRLPASGAGFPDNADNLYATLSTP